MQSLTNRVKQVDRAPMNAVEKLYVWNIFKGMMITLKHFFKRKATSLDGLWHAQGFGVLPISAVTWAATDSERPWRS